MTMKVVLSRAFAVSSHVRAS